MKDLVSLVFLFVIISVALFSGVGALGTIHSLNTGNCAYNATGGIENCSLSNAQFIQQNASATAYANTFTTLSTSTWFIITAILISMMLLFLGLLKRR